MEKEKTPAFTLDKDKAEEFFKQAKQHTADLALERIELHLEDPYMAGYKDGYRDAWSAWEKEVKRLSENIGKPKFII